MTEQTATPLAMAPTQMSNQNMIARLFTEARTHKAFLDRPVAEATLRHLYDIAKFAPSASNLCRIFVVGQLQQKRDRCS